MHRSSFLASVLAMSAAASYEERHPLRHRRTVLPTSRRTPVVQKAAPSPWKGHGRERYAFEREVCLFCGAKEGVACRVVDGDPYPFTAEEAAFVDGAPVLLHVARFKRMGHR